MDRVPANTLGLSREKAPLGISVQLTTIACVVLLIMMVTGIGLTPRLHIAGAYCLVEGGIIASALTLSAALRKRSFVFGTVAGICLLGYLVLGFVIFPRNVDELQTDLNAMKLTSSTSYQ